MRLRINQIICTGRITYKRKPEELNFHRKKETLFNNSLTITRFNFTFNICKNIAFIFNNNINRLLKNCISKVTNEKISSLFVKVSNIQYSRKINFNQTTLVNTFLPLLQKTSTINQIFITQEPKVPSLTTLDTIFTLQNLTYLAFTLKLLKNKATIKLQLSKEKKETHLTLILMNFYEDAQKLVTFLNDKHLVPLREHYINMTSPVPQETITLNAAELKQTIIKALLSSINHHYSLTALQTKFNIPMTRKYDEAELTIMYHNYMSSASKKQEYISLLGCLFFNNKQKFQHFLKNFGTEFLINIYLDEELLNYEEKNPLDWLIQLNTT